MRILGLDPGAVNFAFTLTVDKELVEHGFIIPVEGHDFEAFGKRFANLLDRLSPEMVVFERFQVRGRQSHTAEPVNCMLGYIMNILDRAFIPWYRITASQWKNYYKKPLKKPRKKKGSTKVEEPKAPKKSDKNKPDRPNYGLKSHEADAACMAHYLETYWIQRSTENEVAAKKKRQRAAQREAEGKPPLKLKRTKRKKTTKPTA